MKLFIIFYWRFSI